MKTSDFYYDLPKERIAQKHAEPRDHSRLLVMDRKTGETTDRHFYDLPAYLRPGDVLVLNNSKVIPARIYGTKPTGAHVELLLLKATEGNKWECLVRPGKRLHTGAEVVISDELRAVIGAELIDGKREVEFFFDPSKQFYDILDRVGRMPVPSYITKELDDNSEYNTVYAKTMGSAAAPTAGLHYTPELLQKLKDMGVIVTEVTLHVGLGTFRPVKEDNITDHIMHSEWYTVSEETAQIIRDAKAEGRRVICNGTTACRTVESVYQKHGQMVACSEDTSIFIYPGYEFGIMDGLITNFHLPESTLIMLVSAFAGYEHTMEAYKGAVEKQYRFYSFGDAMLIV